MLKIADSFCVYAMDKDNSPVARCKPGDSVVFETRDCFSNRILSEDDRFEAVGWENINPATGPLYVEGAEPGDTLRLFVEDIRVRSPGVMTAVGGMGALGHLLSGSITKMVPIEHGVAVLSEKVRVPVDPMIGVIGTAPAKEPVPCGTPGPHGGNMDTRHIRKGTVLYLPVAVSGALLSVGDLHAAMGDGEVLICGVEVAGTVTLQIDLLKAVRLPSVVLKDRTDLYFIHSAADLDEAAQGALEAAFEFAHETTGADPVEIAMAFSTAGHLEISQVVDPLKTARFRLPLWLCRDMGLELV